MKATDRRRLEKHIAKWQPRLGLQEWRVTLLNNAPDSATAAAETHWDQDVREAEIRMSPDIVGRYDEEHGVVHELLHLTDAARQVALLLKHNPVLEPSLKVPYERMLDDTARFLLRLEEGSEVHLH